MFYRKPIQWKKRALKPPNLDVSEAVKELLLPGEGVGRVKLPPAHQLSSLEVRVHLGTMLFKGLPVYCRLAFSLAPVLLPHQHHTYTNLYWL